MIPLQSYELPAGRIGFRYRIDTSKSFPRVRISRIPVKVQRYDNPNGRSISTYTVRTTRAEREQTMVSKSPSTRYQSIKDQREEMLSSLYYDNPWMVALDLRAKTYLDWTANPVFWEEINSLVPINMVKFMTNLNKEGM